MTIIPKVTLAALIVAVGFVAPLVAFADTFDGTEGDDNIRGTNDDDEIFSKDGSDIVRAGGGDDYIEDTEDTGDPTTNRLVGGRGNDEILGQSDDSEYIAYGNSGHDKITINVIHTAIAYGGSGNDMIDLGADGGLEAYGGAGDDHIIASEFNTASTVEGGSGDDVMDLSLDGGIADGGKGEDKMRAFGNFLMVEGGADDDELVATGGGEIQFFGGKGDDTFISEDEFVSSTFTGGAGADDFQCGPGHESVTDYDPDEGDTVSDDCEEVNS